MGFFLYIFIFVLFLTWSFLYFQPNFENIISFYSIKNETNIKTYDNTDRVFKQQNYIELWKQKNKVFQLKKDYNLFLQTKYFDNWTNTYIDDEEKTSNIAIETINQYSKEFETLNIWKDYQVDTCSRDSWTWADCENFMFTNENDYIIYKIVSDKLRKVNQLMLNNDDLIVKKITISFLKKDTTNSIVINDSYDYFLNPWANLMKFPLVLVNKGETLYVKVKLTDNDI